MHRTINELLKWVNQLYNIKVKTKEKAEIQALSSFGFQYVTEVYLPRKWVIHLSISFGTILIVLRGQNVPVVVFCLLLLLVCKDWGKEIGSDLPSCWKVVFTDI